MRVRIVPRFETRRAIYSARSHSFVDIYIFKACSFRRNEAHRTNFFSPPPISFRLVFSSHFEFLSSPQWYNGSEIRCFCRRFGNVVSRIHGIIKSHDSKASLAHGSYLVYLARCHGQIIQSRCTWRLLMLVKPVAGLTRLRSIRTREWSNRFAFCSFFLFLREESSNDSIIFLEFLFLWLCGEIARIDQILFFLGLEIFLEGISYYRYIARYDREEKF